MTGETARTINHPLGLVRSPHLASTMLHITRTRPGGRSAPGRSGWASLRPGNSHSRGFQPLLAIPDAPPACFVHRTRQAPVPPAARAGSPSQVQCCTLSEYSPGVQLLSRFQKGNPPHSWGAAAQCSRAFARALLPPLAARAGSPSQVQCCTLSEYSSVEESVDLKRKMTQLKLSHFSFGIRQ